MNRIIIISVLIVSAIFVAISSSKAGNEVEIARIIKLKIEKYNFSSLETEMAAKELYDENLFKPFWINKDFTAFLGSIKNSAAEEGLEPSDYIVNVDYDHSSDEAIALSDLEKSNVVLKFIKDLKFGRANKNISDSSNVVATLKEEFKKLHDSADGEKVIGMMAPRSLEYRNLRKILVKTNSLKENDNEVSFDKKEVLRPGIVDSRISAIREKLHDLGYHPMVIGSQQNNNKYDKNLRIAVERFQNDNALDKDGNIGFETYQALYLPKDEKIRKIKLSMERLRWADEKLKDADKYILVNIAKFTATAYENGVVAFSTPVIVGQEETKTPSFLGSISSAKFNPDWTPTDRILRTYVIPRIKADPTLVWKEGYIIEKFSDGEYVRADLDDNMIASLEPTSFPPYRIRQLPGKTNVLGKVRFDLTDSYAVYMHGTPYQFLFNNSKRADSSGCIRIKEIEKLTEFVLNDNSSLEMDKVSEKLNPEADNLTSEFYSLKKEIPVYVTYLTASADSKGNAIFVNDIYDEDKKLYTQLTHQIPYINLASK